MIYVMVKAMRSMQMVIYIRVPLNREKHMVRRGSTCGRLHRKGMRVSGLRDIDMGMVYG